MTGDGSMSNWISLNELLNRWNIENFEVGEYLNKGLQPYTKDSGIPLDCPSFCHSGPINEDIINNGLAILSEAELYGRELDEIEMTLVAGKEIAEKELEVIKKDDPGFFSWKWLTDLAGLAEYAGDDFKRLFSYLDEAIFKLDDVLEFESKHDLGTSKEPDRFSGHKENYFHLHGDYWEIGYKGKETKLKNLERLRYIIHLLDNAGKEIYSHDLVKLVKGDSPKVNNDYAKMEEERLETEEGLSLAEIYTPDLSDEERTKLEDLAYETWDGYKSSIGSPTQKEQEKNWEAAKRHFRNEYDLFIYESKKGLKFYKKARLKKDIEKARVNVSQNISKAIKDIETELPALGRHLRNQIDKGAKCIYRADADDPITWDISM